MPEETKSAVVPDNITNADYKDDLEFLDKVEPLVVNPTEKKEEKKDGEVEVRHPKKKEEETKEETEEEKEEREAKEKEEEENKGKKEDKEDKEETPEFLSTRPTWSDISKKYPNIFKDFPDLKHVIGREMEFAKLYPTVEEAKEAKENAQAYENVESLFASGDASGLLASMKEADSDAFVKFTTGFLPHLAKVDEQTYFKIVSPTIHGLLNNVYSGAGKDENLKNATLVLSEHLFGKAEVIEKPPIEQKVEPATNKEQETFRKERFQSVVGEVTKITQNDIKDYAFEEITKLFPDDKIPDSIAETIMELIESGINRNEVEMRKDESYMNLMNSLWKRAFASNFTGDWQERIVNAYLSRAKKLIPSIVKRVSPLVPQGKARIEKKVPSGKSDNTRSNSVPESKKINWRETSDRDFLEGNIKIKGD